MTIYDYLDLFKNHEINDIIKKENEFNLFYEILLSHKFNDEKLSESFIKVLIPFMRREEIL